MNWLAWLEWLLPAIITLISLACWILTLIGMPGNWGLVIVAGLGFFFANPESPLHVTLPIWIGMLLVAAVGEILEFAASSIGVNKLGGSKKGAMLAVVGSIVGAVAGIILGVPIPIVGSLVAAVVFGCFGAFGGAILGERWDGKEWEEAIKIGWGAFWGRLFGTVLKTLCGTILLIAVVVSVWTVRI
ncbi:MAG: DUF456 family protein [Pirellula sp.]